MKIALVHDWFDGYRGGEKVLETLASLFPEAPIFTLFFDYNSLPSSLKNKTFFYPSALNKLRRFRKKLLPILPAAIESLDAQQFDLLISSSSCVAKGIIPNPMAKHICYIHSPMRYVWDQSSSYDCRSSRIPGLNYLFHLYAHKLRLWDSVSSQRIDYFVANSSFVSARVKKYYRRDSIVIPPPVDIEKIFSLLNSVKDLAKEDYYVSAGAFVPYKRFDLVIAAFKKNKKKLIIAGSGPLLSRLMKDLPSNITILNKPNDQTLLKTLAKARAFVMPGVEDFGILPIEALACGTPVLAYHKGGSVDYVVEGKTGCFFTEQTVDSIVDCIDRFDNLYFSKSFLQNYANNFNHKTFKSKFLNVVDKVLG
jgi:glycosyltransferase involved in cell wall biosynthesis